MDIEDLNQLDEIFVSQAENIMILQGLPTYQQIQKINGNQMPTQCDNQLQVNQNSDSYQIQSSPQSDSEDINGQIQFLLPDIGSEQPQVKKESIKKTRKRKATKKTKRIRSQLNSQTKNIPKNYGKQLVKFIKTQKKVTQQVLKAYNSKITYEKLIIQLKVIKKTLNKISDLRRLWTDYSFSKQMRILSGIFLRKYSLSWIFNSRIENVKYPIKYRYRIIEGVSKPYEFKYLKDF